MIAKHPSIAEEVRRELEVAFEIMNGTAESVSNPETYSSDKYEDVEVVE